MQDGITGATYAYDANGNMTSGGGHVMTWTSFNRVKRLSQTWWGDWYRSFTYNGEYERVKTVQSDPVDPSGQTIYINPGTQQVPFYEVTTGSEASTRVYVSFGGKVVSQVRTTIASGVMQYHLMTDSQGSIISEGAYGTVTQDMAYDAWGKTRDPDAGSDYGLPPEGGWAWHNERLYTGHESHQDQYVINMNGRLYDPVLSRMLSADPFVPGAGNNPQGLNRYAYVFNNPLRYTDPDGFKPIWKKQWFRVAVAVAASVAIPAATEAWFTVALNSATAGAVAAGAAGGFAGGLIASGGNLEAAFKGAVVGAAGGWADTLKGFEAYAGQAAAGCLSGAVQGGGCGQGARSAVVGKAVSVGVDSAQVEYGRAGEFVAATVGGGITSRIDGESFGKGAARAASMMTAVEASRYYESKVGWQADARPGDEVYVNSKGERGAYDHREFGGRSPGSNIIVIGRNKELTDDYWSWSNFDKQGGPLSLALNVVPGMNATGHLHDWWFNSRTLTPFNHVTNFGSMIPAAAVTYSAVLGNHLHGWHQNSTSWSYISQSQRQRR